MNCKICNATTHKLLEQLVLQKHMVSYYQCTSCSFIQTEQPYWLPEAYERIITSLDIGLLARNLYLNEVLPKLIDAFFADAKHMIDYGGGYGIFVRLMRDKGYNFYRQDIYCENLFANYFDVSDSNQSKFDLLTTFEVFEHLDEPLAELEKMFQLSDNVIFTTVLAPDKPADFKNWWYVSPLTGQHIAFYSSKTLEYLAHKFGKKLYSNTTNLHLFTNKELDAKAVNKVLGITKASFVKRIKNSFFPQATAAHLKPSLLPADYAYIEKKLTNS